MRSLRTANPIQNQSRYICIPTTVGSVDLNPMPVAAMHRRIARSWL